MDAPLSLNSALYAEVTPAGAWYAAGPGARNDRRVERRSVQGAPVRHGAMVAHVDEPGQDGGLPRSSSRNRRAQNADGHMQAHRAEKE